MGMGRLGNMRKSRETRPGTIGVIYVRNETICLKLVTFSRLSIILEELKQVGDLIMLARVDSTGECGIIHGGLEHQIRWHLQLCSDIESWHCT